MPLGEGARDGRGHEIVERAAEGGDLAHAARREEAVLGRGHQVDGLDLGCEALVEVPHLELPLVVRDGTDSLDERDGAPLARVLDHEGRERGDDHVRQVVERVSQERHALRHREGGLLVRGLADDRDDEPVEEGRRPPDHVDVPQRDRVVAAGAERGAAGCECRLGFDVGHAAHG